MTGTSSLVFYSSAPLTSIDDLFCYEMICETPGQTGNGKIGGLLPIDFISGLTAARLTALVLPGTDEQDDDSLRHEYMESLRDFPFAGNIAAYRSFILSQNEIGAVQVYPHWRGGGTVLCSILDSNYNPATQGLVEVIQNLVCPSGVTGPDPSPSGFGIAPIGAKVTISTATPLLINIDTTILLSTGVSVEGVSDEITQAVSNYFLSIRRGWGNALITNQISYPVAVYISQINSLILQITGIINILDTELNGVTNDLNLTQTGELQEIPAIGVITVNGQIIYGTN